MPEEPFEQDSTAIALVGNPTEAETDPERDRYEAQAGGDECELEDNDGGATVMPCQHDGEDRAGHGGLNNEHALQLGGGRQEEGQRDEGKRQDEYAKGESADEKAPVLAEVETLEEVGKGDSDED